MATTWTPDPTFYPSAEMAMAAPSEKLAYVATINPTGDGRWRRHHRARRRSPSPRPTASSSADSNSRTPATSCTTSAGTPAARALCPTRRTRTSSGATCSCPASARRGSTSSTPSPTRGSRELVKTIEPEDARARAATAAPHTVHCGPDGIYVNALGAPDGDGPGGIFVLDHDDLRRARAPGRTTAGRSTCLRLLVAPRPRHDDHQRVGHAEHGRERRQSGAAARRQVRPPRCTSGTCASAATCRRSTWARSSRWCSSCARRTIRTRRYGFVGVVTLAQGPLRVDLDLVPRERQRLGRCEKVIEIPAEPADPDAAAAAAARRSARCRRWSPTSTCRLDDRFLYVSCWGTGELPAVRRHRSVQPRAHRLGAARRHRRHAPHPREPDSRSNGGPQMVEVSRDGRRVYVTNSLYTPWDAQFYPDGIRGWMVKLDVNPRRRHALDPSSSSTSRGASAHQVRLQGGDASSDSFCFPD